MSSGDKMHFDSSFILLRWCYWSVVFVCHVSSKNFTESSVITEAATSRETWPPRVRDTSEMSAEQRQSCETGWEDGPHEESDY